ncbi:putative 6-phosphofructokinase [Dictyocaulus viviparus]|uniref:Putative 6-phosphofructokinase n=1 Tax=Dictyocaulus viviparus TaxID=29172 RepID=A0A0D8X8R0_DICVI|nr:putative 6-phosphofructokinase [Dictyocaulus viviparus]
MINNNIEEAKWESASYIIHLCGSIIGFSRCEAFRQRAQRKRAALTLHTHNVYHLICIGGFGSLTGLSIFRDEWEGFTTELFNEGKITREQADIGKNLIVVGIAGTIDNDLVGTDRTIGFDSAVTRITECVDNLMATTIGHHRTFVVEVTGRECGNLALTAALALEADFVFIPEIPPVHDWPRALCNHLSKKAKANSRLHLVIVSEGSTDGDRKPITAINIKDVVEERLKHEVHVVQLGCLQKGGCPSFLDRYLGSRMGYEAVNTILSSNLSPYVLCLKGHVIIRVSLSTIICKTRLVHEEARKGFYGEAVNIRGKNFQQKAKFIQLITQPPKLFFGVSKNFAVIHVGSPTAGMNGVTHAFVRIANHSNYNVYGIERSWEGLMEGKFTLLNWENVDGWMSRGGSELGTKRQLPTDVEKIAIVLADQNIEGLLIVGGFEAFHSAKILHTARSTFSAFNIPIIVIPCCTANNVPGRE